MTADKKWLFFLLSGYVAILITGLHNYVLWHSLSVQLGGLTILLSLLYQPQGPPVRRYRFGIAALVFLVLFCCLPFKHFLLAALVCGAFFAVECFIKRVPLAAVLAVCFASSAADFAANLFTFPIRLQLSKIASGILTACGLTAYAEGNVIRCGSTSFAVDPACMGLQMLMASLLAALLLVVVYQKRYARRLPARWVGLLLAAVLVLNIVANLYRITCLVYFALLPGTWGHECMGICCWCICVLVPAVFLTRKLVQTKGALLPSTQPVLPARRVSSILHVLLLAGVGAALALRGHYQAPPATSLTGRLPGYQKTLLPGNVARFVSSNGLIYVKAIPGFYATEHHPMICWKGSGYQFTHVQEQQVAGHTVYMAQLNQDTNRLYTAWWYYNGSHHTISQLAWRSQAATGANNYALINITSHSEDTLVKEIINFTHQYHF
ncbi:exosortase N [Filimonas zeae]|uniref:Exosortase N n=1 Tax=Filimonas zeae TaxID=1737353 RepID=A0A917MV56_9BACT|nr:exosortase N [Filimonas zeae]MDR6338899.1 exosortase N [Filimonas zeae]GGH66062.1 hypothetical protein GCM10011379_19840 [Filimonas zeae]